MKYSKLLNILFFSIILSFFLFNAIGQQSPETIVEKAVVNYLKNSDYQSYEVKAVFYEYAVDNGKICMFTDAYGYLCSAAYNCPIPVDSYSFVAEQIRKSNRSDKWLKQLKNLYKKTPVRLQSDFSPGWNCMLNSFRRIELYGILNPGNINNYSFTQLNVKKDGTLEIKFTSKENSKINGILTINPKTSSIQKLIINNTKYYSNQLWGWSVGNMDVSFKNINGKILPKDMNITVANNGFEYNTAIIVTANKILYNSISENDFTMFSENDNNPFVNYNESSFNISISKDILTKAYNDFGGKQTLTKQFTENADKLFYDFQTYMNEDKSESKGKQLNDYIQNKIILFKQSEK